jgi:hypothetical protein
MRIRLPHGAGTAIVCWCAATACATDPPPDARATAEQFGVIIMELRHPASWTGGSSPCFESLPADVDSETPGPQYECSVVMHTDVDARVVGECDAGPTPRRCWRIVEDVTDCSLYGLKLDLVHTEEPPERYVILAQCVLPAIGTLRGIFGVKTELEREAFPSDYLPRIRGRCVVD